MDIAFLPTNPNNLSQRHFDKRNDEDPLKKKGVDNSSSTTKEAGKTVATLKEGDNNNILSNPQTVAPKANDGNWNGEEPFDDTKVSNESKDRSNSDKCGDEDIIETDDNDLGGGRDFDGNDNGSAQS